MTQSKGRIVSALTAALAVVVVAAGCGSDGGGGGAKTKAGLTQVSMGTVNGSSSDAAMFVGMDKGFFREQGIEIKLQPFNTGAQFVAPLGAGRLDAASGGISAGLFNAVGSGVNIKLVADKSRIGRPSYTSLLVRKQLVDSGKYKGFGDLKGLKVAIPSVGVPPHHELDLFLRKAGLTIKDVRLEQIGFADMVSALSNGSVDAAVAIEPSATKAVQTGDAVKVAGVDEVFPGEDTAALFYSEQFIKDKPEAAQKLMDAYLKSVRYYVSALDGSTLKGQRGEEVARILTKYTAIKDPKVFMKIPLHVVDPDGQLDAASIQKDVDFWRAQGLIKSDVAVKDAIDSSFIDKSVKTLGPPEESAK